MRELGLENLHSELSLKLHALHPSVLVELHIDSLLNLHVNAFPVPLSPSERAQRELPHPFLSTATEADALGSEVDA